MPAKKDAAYWREYRARQRVAQQQSAGLQPVADAKGISSDWGVHGQPKDKPSPPPNYHHAACDRRIAELEAENARLRGQPVEAHYDIAAAHPVAEMSFVNPDDQAVVGVPGSTFQLAKPDFLRGVVDDCTTCGHPWHNDEDGCRAPAAMGPKRPCGCKLYSNDPAGLF